MQTCKYLIKAIFTGLVFLFLVSGISSRSLAQTVDPATGGENISADHAADGSWTTLDGPVIQETSPGQLTSGTIRLTLPDGFEWDTGGTDPSLTVSSPKGSQIDLTLQNRSETEVVFQLEGSSQGPPPNNPHTLTFEDLRVRPTDGSPLASGELRNVGSAAPGGNTNYGNLSMTEGADDRILVETAPDRSGSLVSEQELQAGSSITIYSIVRDQFDNFKRNEAADNWNIENSTGGVDAGALTPSGDSRSAEFRSEQTGAAEISASFGGLTSINSGTITVTPAEASDLIIETRPSTTATAGEPFGTQPVIEIHDQYGNIVTGDNSTEVTAFRNSGEGELQGTVTRTASDGVVTFNDLYHTVAGEIDIEFASGGFASLLSSPVTVNPAGVDSLTFIVQPPNDIVNQALDPAPELQVVDTYGNSVSEQGLDITVEQASGSGVMNGTLTETTDAEGIAVFDNLLFDQQDTYVIRATGSGLGISEDSREFIIAEAGTLADFEIEIEGGGEIGIQEAGTGFALRITAVDGNGDVLDGTSGRDLFEERVYVDSEATFLSGNDSTATFQDGVLSAHTVNLSSAGPFRINATDPGNNITGDSNEFTVDPAVADRDSSFFSLSTDSLTADGNDESEVTITLVDEYGNGLTEGGNTVDLQLSGEGTVSEVADNSDGTYTATLTAPTSAGSATLTASLEGDSIRDDNGSVQEATVQYVPGALATFLIEDLPQDDDGTVSQQTAGESFDVQITALDANGNTVTDFDETAEITSSGTLTEGEGTTAQFEDGFLAGHALTITQADSNTTITARRSGFSESGSSNAFVVNPAAADPGVSVITSERSYLENNGTDNTTITLQLKDEFGNNLVHDIRDDGETVALDDNGASAFLTDFQYAGAGSYTATLTASNSTETVTVSGTINGTDMTDTATIGITEVNRWIAAAGGQPGNEKDWSNTQNWSLNSLPAPGQIVLISPEDENGNAVNGYPILDESNQNEVNPEIDFLVIEEGANLTMSSRSLTINEEITGGGSLFADDGTITLNGNSGLASFIAGSSVVNLSGGSAQEISGDFTADQLNVQQDVTVLDYVESFSTVTIDAGQALSVEDGGKLVAFGDININGALVGNNASFRFGGDITGTDITLNNTSVEFDGDAPQQMNGFGNFNDLTIDNPTEVTALTDIVVNGTLYMDDGTLIITSGYSLVANNKTGNVENLRMQREVDGQPGWRLIAPPLSSTYDDFLDGTLTQGYPNSQLGETDSNGDDLQPSVLYYDETFEGTDNQRWRAPADASDNLTRGRGMFVYFFGDEPGDDRYNDPLPDMIDFSGAEFGDGAAEVPLPVTYTADADTGWNMVGNPYAATIDWDDGNWTKEHMDHTIYVWNPETGDYDYWNGLTGSLGDGLIAPFQGFWVKANGEGTPNLRVQSDSKTTGGNFQRHRNDKPIIEFRLETSGKEKTAHLSFTNEGRTGKDRYDAYRLLPFDTGTYLELYTLMKDGTQLSINNLSRDFGQTLEIPVHVGGFEEYEPIGGTFTLSWPEMKEIPDAWSIKFIDTHRGEEIDLRRNDFYSFEHQAGKGKAAPVNEPGRFKLLEKSKSKTENARFILQIEPGEDAEGIPDEFELLQNYPNPFSSSTTIPFATPVEGEVTITAWDILGRKVRTITNRNYDAGYHEERWNAGNIASGVYILRMQAGAEIFHKKITLIQ